MLAAMVLAESSKSSDPRAESWSSHQPRSMGRCSGEGGRGILTLSGTGSTWSSCGPQSESMAAVLKLDGIVPLNLRFTGKKRVPSQLYGSAMCLSGRTLLSGPTPPDAYPNPVNLPWSGAGPDLAPDFMEWLHHSSHLERRSSPAFGVARTPSH